MANDNCSSAQTFCNINGQLVKNNINIAFPEIGTQYSAITPEWKQQVINILRTIHNYGNKGTRNPTTQEINNLNSISSNQTITPEDYNEIIKILDGPLVLQHNHILGTYYSDLKKYINNYKLNADRCNTCNTGCNTTCQESHQCEDYCNSCNITCDTNCESMDAGVSCGKGCGLSEACGACDSGLRG